MSITEEIRDKLDIVQYIGQYASLKKSGRHYKACCPFHSEKTPSFIVNQDQQSWRCFGACAEGGDIFSFAMKMNNWDFREALQELSRLAGVEVQKRTPQQKKREAHIEGLRAIADMAAGLFHQHLMSDEADAVAARQYAMAKRGFSEQTLHDFQIGLAAAGWQSMIDQLRSMGYAEDDIIEVGLASRSDNGRIYDRFRNRLIIPIRDPRGRVVGFGARALAPDDNPKYLNSPQTPLFDKSRILFGLDRARDTIRESGTVVIVEGYMDAIQAHQAGYTNVVAQMGTAMTETQLKLVAPRDAQTIVMALDADAAGQNATRRSLEVARETLEADYAGRMSVDIRVLHMPDAKDPDDLLRETPEQWPQLVAQALPVADFVIAMETAQLPANASIQQRQQVASSVLPLLMASENNIYRQDNIQKLALKLRIDEDLLIAWARDQQRLQKTTRKRRPPAGDEPPPLDLDTIAPPPDEDEDTRPEPTGRAAPERRLAARNTSRSTEAYCLRALLLNPDLIYQANRKLRELAISNTDLQRDALADLGPQDFSHSDYRFLMIRLSEAINQHDQEPLDFLRSHLDEVLLAELGNLLVQESQNLMDRMRGRFRHDLKDYLDKHQRQPRDTTSDVIEQVLRLRDYRLRREVDEIQYLLREDQQPDDAASLAGYNRQITLTSLARVRIQQELHQAKSS